MTDTAQLREAVDAYRALFPNSYADDPLAAAATELLALKEAGALIIVPDEDGWPFWAVDRLAQWKYERDLGEGDWATWLRDDEQRETWWRFGRKVLNALRDAKPEGPS